MRYSEHDAELDRMKPEELQLLLMQLRGKVREVMSAVGNARCHITLHELFELLPEGDSSFLGLADKQAFLKRCEVFYETAQCPSEAGAHTCHHCHGAGVIPPEPQTRP